MTAASTLETLPFSTAPGDRKTSLREGENVHTHTLHIEYIHIYIYAKQGSDSAHMSMPADWYNQCSYLWQNLLIMFKKKKQQQLRKSLHM